LQNTASQTEGNSAANAKKELEAEQAKDTTPEATSVPTPESFARGQANLVEAIDPLKKTFGIKMDKQRFQMLLDMKSIARDGVDIFYDRIFTKNSKTYSASKQPQGYRVVTFDHFGFIPSTKPANIIAEFDTFDELWDYIIENVSVPGIYAAYNFTDPKLTGEPTTLEDAADAVETVNARNDVTETDTDNVSDNTEETD
jgi:hypothetical protein